MYIFVSILQKPRQKHTNKFKFKLNLNLNLEFPLKKYSFVYVLEQMEFRYV